MSGRIGRNTIVAPQVLKLKIDLLASLAARPGFTRRSAMFCLTELVDKIGDVKNGASVQAALSYIAEATTLEYVSEEVRKILVIDLQLFRFFRLVLPTGIFFYIIICSKRLEIKCWRI